MLRVDDGVLVMLWDSQAAFGPQSMQIMMRHAKQSILQHEWEHEVLEPGLVEDMGLDETWRLQPPTCSSAYACSGHTPICVVSSSTASIGCSGCDPTFKLRRWHEAGMPVMGSRRPLSVATLHAGDTRRSEEEVSDLTSKGTSCEVEAMLGSDTEFAGRIRSGRARGMGSAGAGFLFSPFRFLGFDTGRNSRG